MLKIDLYLNMKDLFSVKEMKYLVTVYTIWGVCVLKIGSLSSETIKPNF